MNAPVHDTQSNAELLDEALQRACDAVAPTWPLDQLIAVNPYWGHVEQPFNIAASHLSQIGGSRLTMQQSYYRAQWQEGRIEVQHLRQANKEFGGHLSEKALLDALELADSALTPAPLLCDSLDSQRDLLHEPAWCDTITHQIAQFCAAYFDRDQADWHPNQEQALYASWRETLSRDHSVALLMKAAHIPAKAKALAPDSHTQLQRALEQLGVEPTQWARYFEAVLMRVSGWAAWCAYRRWQARLAGGDDQALLDLLAIRLSWECLIDDAKRHTGSAWKRWQQAWWTHFHRGDQTDLDVLAIWQRAHEIGYQQTLCKQLATAYHESEYAAPSVQAVFCIDVRSEVFRRHLEAQSTAIQTLGFAGFFGLPISYTPLGTQATRAQLPGLLAPAIDVTDSSGDTERDEQIRQRRQRNLKAGFAKRPWQIMPGSSFTLVETLGLGYIGKLFRRSMPTTSRVVTGVTSGFDKSDLKGMRPTLQVALAGDLEQQAELAARVLRGMGLAEGAMAPLVLLIGHGSQSANNPHGAGLDCGACCGQTGEVNARALAGLLNDAAVRERLLRSDIHIPSNTRFIAGLHNTTTDDVALFDTDNLPATLHRALTQLTDQLAAAGLAARRERAPALGLEHLQDKPGSLTRAVKQRANDWAQTRPEWGLANNAAFIVAPRSRTRGVKLGGRSFLHDYDHHKDPDNSLLELIMTAPMVVTHWINMQYYASTVDNQRYGSGNKLLHNVVGGRLGVFEGNGGDLRIGLAWQSIHDGANYRHEPLRLTVVIDAPATAIEAVIAKHDLVRNLVNNQWLYLARFQGNDIVFYRRGEWLSLG